MLSLYLLLRKEGWVWVKTTVLSKTQSRKSRATFGRTSLQVFSEGISLTGSRACRTTILFQGNKKHPSSPKVMGVFLVVYESISQQSVFVYIPNILYFILVFHSKLSIFVTFILILVTFILIFVTFFNLSKLSIPCDTVVARFRFVNWLQPLNRLHNFKNQEIFLYWLHG